AKAGHGGGLGDRLSALRGQLQREGGACEARQPRSAILRHLDEFDGARSGVARAGEKLQIGNRLFPGCGSAPGSRGYGWHGLVKESRCTVSCMDADSTDWRTV